MTSRDLTEDMKARRVTGVGATKSSSKDLPK
jgi:hypothetical protein